MSNSEILFEKRNSLAKMKSKESVAAEEVQKVSVEKVTLAFELQVLSKERKNTLSRIENTNALKKELTLKRDIYLRKYNENKLSLKVFNDQIAALTEEVETLKRSAGHYNHENKVLAELLERIVVEVEKKRSFKDEKATDLLILERELISKKNNYDELCRTLQDTTSRINELVTSQRERKFELDELNQKLNDTQYSLEMKMIDFEKVNIDFNAFEQERLTKVSQLDKLNEELNRVTKQVADNKAGISNIRTQLLILSDKILIGSNNFEKLKELEMLTSLTLDHIVKEGDDLRRRMKIIEEQSQSKQKDLKKLTDQLKEQEVIVRELKKAEKTSNVRLSILTESIERTHLLVLTNEDLLDQYEDTISGPPALPRDF